MVTRTNETEDWLIDDTGEAEKESPGNLTSPWTILIVDDETDIRELVAGILEDEGHGTRTAGDCDRALQAIAAHFGSPMLNDDGTLNRRLLREKIFAHVEEKAWLNALLHPLIQQETRRQMQAATSPYLLWVVPLLVENRLSSQADRVLVVDVPKETQIERTMLRDKVSREHAEHILAAQATREQRLAVADDVIENTGTPDAVASDVARLHEKYLMLALQVASQENS